MEGPFKNIQAQENPEWDPPIITILGFFIDLIFSIVSMKHLFYKKASDVISLD
jgi:hypothetical protein